MDLITTIICVTVLVLGYKMWRRLSRPAPLPPGPLCLPLIGDPKLLTNRYFFQYIDDLHKKYGDILYLKMLGFPKPLLILNTYPIMNEAFTKMADIFSDRPLDRTNLLFSDGGRSLGVVAASGQLAKDLRRFTLLALRGFGMGGFVSANFFGEFLLNAMDDSRSEVDHTVTIQKAVSNVICKIVFGQRFDYNNEDFKQLLTDLNDQFTDEFTRFWDSWLPLWFIKYLIRVDSPTSCQREKRLRSFVDKRIKEHQESFDVENIRDFVDLFVKEFLHDGGQRTEGYSINESQFTSTIVQLFVAGTETTATTLRWAILFMLHHPDVAGRVQDEIEQVIGRGRLPVWSDRSNMPYTEATLMEIQRLSSIASGTLFHGNNRDVIFHGYFIPKETLVLGNLWSTHMDERVWPDADKFSPQRFLSETGKLLKNDALVPFSIGRRMCLGEQLAKMELFIFFTAIMQNFDLKMADGQQPTPIQVIEGFTLSPKPFKFSPVRR